MDADRSSQHLEDLLIDQKKRAFWLPKILALVECLYDVEASGLQHIDSFRSKGCPLIVASDHSRLLDGFVMGSVVPELDFAVSKEELWFNPFLRYFVPDLGGIPAVRKDRLGSLRDKYGPDVYSRFITEAGEFRFEQYIPPDRAGLLLEDIARVVGRVTEPKTRDERRIYGMENVDSLVISQYVLLKGRKVLLFPQGTRKSSLDLKNVKFGLYNILHDLSVFHRQDIPVVPASIRYEGGLFYKSAVSVSFAPPRYVSPYLGGSFDRPHEAFMSDVAQDIRALAKL